jgi:KAP-like P-loop domain-containing protein
MTDIKYYIRPPEYIEDGEPFKNDLFERSLLAERLTTYVNGLAVGCVIGIDAPWGEGKTYFGKNWEAKLKAEGYKTIYLDAFEQDYSDDPFLIISAEILSGLRQDQDESWVKFHDACVNAGKVLLPTAAKFTVNTLGKLFLGISDLSDIKDNLDEVFEEKVGDASEKYIQTRLKEYDKEKKTVKRFKKSLDEFAAAQEKPVVFFIDELDRCKPSFAVQVIERIKHFFDTPNLIFVLLLNRTQLEEAIKGVYGTSLDAHAYLGKFVHFFLTLPKHTTTANIYRNFNRIYCVDLAKRYKYPNTTGVETFVDSLGVFATVFNLSLRDMEKTFIHFTLGQPINISAPLSAYLLCLKLHNSSMFYALARWDIEVQAKLLETLKSHLEASPDCWQLKGIVVFHTGAISGTTDLTAEQKSDLRLFLDSHSLDLKTYVTSVIKRIDTVLVD